MTERLADVVHELRRMPRPLQVSFSGGRSSGLLLRGVRKAWPQRLPDDVVVLFANTGKERAETLDFVARCGAEWDLPIIWVERRPAPERYAVVSHNTAARHGEPFAQVIRERKYLPNVVTRFCTQELKLRPMQRYLQDVRGWSTWHVAIGLRADEDRRVARIKGCGAKRVDSAVRHLPLADAGVRNEDVLEFWSHQSFDLDLPVDADGVTAAGNCDLCYLKGAETTLGLLKADPQRADWWIAREREIGARFRCDRPGYRTLVQIATGELDRGALSWRAMARHELSALACECTD